MSRKQDFPGLDAGAAPARTQPTLTGPGAGIGAAVAVVGPSGAGKDTLMAAAQAAHPGLHLARRVITRPSEAGGEDFEGVTLPEFQRRKEAGEFALSWPAHGLHYGLPWTGFQRGGTVLFNASRAVLAEAQQRFPGLRVLLVTASPEVLAARLAGRGRETAEDQLRRLARAGFQLPPGIAARTVLNDSSLEEGVARFLAALQPESA